MDYDRARATAARLLANAKQGQVVLARAVPGEPDPDQVFETSEAFLAVSEVLGPAERRSLRGTDPHRARGMLAMRLSIPVRDTSAPEVWRERAAQIAAAFPADLWVEFQGQRVRIRENGDVLAGYQDGGWCHLPIQARWEAMV